DFPARCQVIAGTVRDLPPASTYDTILYIDVLEHIEDDKSELTSARSHLRGGGHLIILSPAHLWLSSAFDRAIGHCRRYSAKSLKPVVPVEMLLVRLCYLDSVGLLLSLGNRLLLNQSQPRVEQIRLWDRFIVPISRWVADVCVRYQLGKSILGIWRAPSTAKV